MYIKNFGISAAYKAVLVLLCAAALIVDLGLTHGRADWYILNYYTVLSNFACLVFFSLALLHTSKAALGKGGEGFVWRPRTEAAVVFCIAITGIIYATLLAPASIESGTFFTFKNITLHYVVPVMAVLDWLLFCPKGRLRATDPLLWLFIPLAYFAYILVRSTFAGNIGLSDSRFPYDFIDPALQGGWSEMFAGVGWITVGMAALGYVIYAMDRLFSRHNRIS